MLLSEIETEQATQPAAAANSEPNSLQLRVSAIERQERRNRYNVFVNGEFAVALDQPAQRAANDIDNCLGTNLDRGAQRLLGDPQPQLDGSGLDEAAARYAGGRRTSRPRTPPPTPGTPR